jgi:hypothetical protein
VSLIAGMLVSLGVAAGPAAAAGTLDQHQTNFDTQRGLGGTTLAAQTFAAGITGQLDQVDLKLSVVGSPADLTVEITTTTAAGHPTSTVLGTATVSAGSIPTTPTTVSVPLTAPSVAGTQYAIVLSSPTVGWQFYSMSTGPYSAGSAYLSTDSGATWTPIGHQISGGPFVSEDFFFNTYVVPSATPTLVTKAQRIAPEVSSISTSLTPTVGDTLIVEVGVSECVSPTTSGTCNNPKTQSVTDSAGNTFIKLPTPFPTATDGAEETIWLAPVSATSAPDKITAKPSSSPADMSLTVVEYSGIVPGISGIQSEDTTSGSTGEANNFGTGLRANPGDLMLALEMDSGWQATLSPGGGFTTVAKSAPNSTAEFLVESQIASTAAFNYFPIVSIDSSLSFPFSGTAANGSTYTIGGVPWEMYSLDFAHS